MGQITTTVTEVRADTSTKTVRLTVVGSDPLVEFLLFNPSDYSSFEPGASIDLSWAPTPAPAP